MNSTVRADSLVEVRVAVPEDEATLFQWRNLPWVIQAGVSQKAVTRDEHHAWFSETLCKKQRLLFVVEAHQEPAGMIRYDLLDENSVEISIYLMPQFLQQGLGTEALLKSIPQLLSWRKVNQIVARVLKNNQRSLSFFQKSQFTIEEVQTSPEVISLKREIREIQHSRPYLGNAEIEAVSGVVASRHLAHGTMASNLEKSWCELTTMSHAACVGSGLGALRLALLALGIGTQDEVIVPAYSCVALLNAVLALGATPVLADVLEDEWTLSPEAVRRHITKKTRAIIAVHLFGFPAAISELMNLGFPVIEDCAHGLGGKVENQPFGGIGTISIGSFYATKMVAGGGGGIVASRNRQLIDSVTSARDYGDQMPNPHHLNDTITDLEAALAYTQLTRLSEILTLRAEKAQQYDIRLAALAQNGLIKLPKNLPDRIWYRYAIELTRHKAHDVCQWMAQHQVRVEQPIWDLRDCPFWTSNLENATLALDRVVSLPLYPDLNDTDQQIVCHTLSQCLKTL